MRRLFYAVLFMGLAGTLRADPLEGLWLTKPDAKGQVAHVRAEPCAGALCGTIIRAFDRSGAPVITPNVGRRIFWDVRPQPDGSYAGTGWLPLRDLTFKARLRLAQNTLTVSGCIGPICQNQTWTRVVD
ncbi:DUF2147 domain-containing protein [Thalassobius sp. S69A]|uniref:DUF2147 domain-containing protein n=1 Tax=unclassified Thalassovita TaxID=2619711 RepID=UPI003C7E00DA